MSGVVPRLASLLRMLALLAFEALMAIVLLELSSTHGIDLADPIGWLRDASEEAALVAAVHAVAVAATAWLTLSTVVYLVARAARLPRLLRLARRLTIGPIRATIDRGIAAVVVGAALLAPASPALAAVTEDTSEPVTVLPPGDSRGGYMPVPAGFPVDVEPESQHVVVPGDNLWTISEGWVRSQVTDVELRAVVRYWRRVVEVNRAFLRSGDPDLIFPGEHITLPPIEP